MARAYKQLTYADRGQIYALKSTKMSHREIVRHLSFHPRTIDREIKRNTGGRGYRFKQVDERTNPPARHD